MKPKEDSVQAFKFEFLRILFHAIKWGLLGGEVIF
jgi:hypothetical protein